MRILVVYGNVDLMERAKPIFEMQDHKFVFLRDEDLDLNDDLKDYDAIFSLHCHKIFPKWLVESVRCINVHPGYNPHNRGMFPHVWSIINGLPTGATIHLMDDKIDHGKIFVRWSVPVEIYDTSLTLYNKVTECELLMLEFALPHILDGTLMPFAPESEGNYNSLEDYKNMCEVDLSKHHETYNLLRALTHGDYKNARIGNRYLKLEIT